MQEEPVINELEEISAEIEPEIVKRKKTIKGFMDSFKTNLIEMFKEEEDSAL